MGAVSRSEKNVTPCGAQSDNECAGGVNCAESWVCAVLSNLSVCVCMCVYMCVGGFEDVHVRGVWLGGKWIKSEWVCMCVCVCLHAGGGSDYRVCLPHWTPLAEEERGSKHTHSELCVRGGEEGCVWAHVSVWTGDDKPSGKGRMISKNSSKMGPRQDGKKRTWPIALPALDFIEKQSLVDLYFLWIEKNHLTYFLSPSLNRERNKRPSEDQNLPSGAQSLAGFHRQGQGLRKCWAKEWRNEDGVFVLSERLRLGLPRRLLFTPGGTSALCPLLQISKVTSREWPRWLNYSHAVWSEERHQEQHW